LHRGVCVHGIGENPRQSCRLSNQSHRICNQVLRIGGDYSVRLTA